MVYKYKKGKPTQLSPHFDSIHFDCKCKRVNCTETFIDDVLIEACEMLWEIVGPMIVLSGYRCPAHNADPGVGGATNSYHKIGLAADLRSSIGLPGFALARAAEKVPMFKDGGIGIYNTFMHGDVREKPARWGLKEKC